MNSTSDKAKLIFFISVSAASVLYLFSGFGKTLGAIVLPFAVARVCSEFLSKGSAFLCSKAGLPKIASCIIVVTGFYTALFTVLYKISQRLFYEVKGLTQHLTTLGNDLPLYAEKAKAFISQHLPFINFSEKTELFLEKMSLGAVSKIAGSVTSEFASGIPSLITAVPQFFVFILITVVATCYFTLDLKKTNSFILFQLPEKARKIAKEIKNTFFDTVVKYIGAYAAIGTLTFGELFIGFLFICRRYAFVLALAVALLDILPLFGSGAVLIPWAIYEFFVGDKLRCLGLIILYLAVTVVRQVTEPKILGSVMGIHPLIMLFAVYAGAKLMGFTGIFIFPVITIIIKNLNDKGMLNLYREPPQNTEEKLCSVRKKYKRFRKNRK